MSVKKKLYENRFLVLFLALILFFFLPSFFTGETKQEVTTPLTRTFLFLSTYILFRKSNLFKRYVVIVIIILFISYTWLSDLISPDVNIETIYLVVAFAFFLFIMVETFIQILNAERITFQIVMATLSGYLLLGIIGFFAFTFIDFAYPDSFNFVTNEAEQMIYYTFITLTTIGYGDISPQTIPAKNMAILLGILGQFYTTVIIAVIVSKYIQHQSQK